jgi:hypothetical protein
MSRSRTERCHEWPTCGCARTWAFWSRESQWELAEAEAAKVSDQQREDLHEDIRWSLAVMLACVAAHCPDRSKRQFALVQLMNPVFSVVEGWGRWPH